MVSVPPRGHRSARQDSNLQGLAAWGAGRLRRPPRALGSRGRDRTCDFLLNRQAAYHSRTLKWSPSTDLNDPLAGTGRARRHLRLRGGSRGPCCTGRQREVMSLRRETMSTLPAGPARGLEPRSPAYGTGASPATPHRHVPGHRARPGLARTRRPSGLSTVRESNPRVLLAGTLEGFPRPPAMGCGRQSPPTPTRLLGRLGPDRSDNGAMESASAQRDSNPPLLTGSQACSR